MFLHKQQLLSLSLTVICFTTATSTTSLNTNSKIAWPRNFWSLISEDEMKNQKRDVTIKNNIETILNSIVEAKGKKLKGSRDEMSLLNVILEAHPIGIARMNLSHKATTKVFKELTSVTDSPEIIQEKIRFLLAPVKQFFTEIHQNSHLIESLIKECFGIESQNHDLLLLKFLNDKNGSDAGIFFEKEVTNLHSLGQIAYEFIVFFKDLKESLSPVAQESYTKLMHTINKKNAK